MAYTPHTWTAGETIDAAKLNANEAGTQAAAAAADTANSALAGKVNSSTYTAGLAAKADSASLAPVATSGAYSDLTGKPTIPTVTGTNTGDQTLSLNGSSLTISGANGNSVTIPTSGGTTVSDATTSAKGIVQLAGDLGGTAAAPTVPGLAGKLTAASNLSDVANAATARTNLGLGSAATQPTSAFDAAGAAAAVLPTQTGNGGKYLTTNGTAVSWGTPAGGSGSGWPSTVVNKTTAYTAAVGDFVQADVTSAGFTVTLPAAPAVGALVAVKKVDASTNTLTIAPSGTGNIDGDPTATTTTKMAGAVFEHVGSDVWRITSAMATTGAKGDPGTAASVAIGTTTTLAAGSSATVTNVGTSSAAVLNFGIPKGDAGATGGGGSVSVQDEGANLTARSTLNFVGSAVTASDDATNSRTNINVVSEIVPGYHSGVWYTAPVQRGGGAMAASVLTAFPFYVPSSRAFDRITCYLTAAGAGGTPTIRLGIYANVAGDSIPGSLVLDAGTVDATTTGQKDIIITQTLAPGWYWLAGVAQGATTTQPTPIAVGRADGATQSVGGMAVGTTSVDTMVLATYLIKTGVTGALPASWGGTYTVNSQVCPIVWLRAA